MFGTGLSLMSSHLLVCGIPATGKSTYSAWLEHNKNFLHLDIDAESDSARKSPSGSLERELAKRFFLIESQGNARRFIEYLAVCKKPVVVDWGFPTKYLWIVKELQQRGLHVWWLDGDRSAAREAFKKRGTGNIESFDCQIKKITEYWSDIQSVVEQKVIDALDSEGRHRSPQALYEVMFG